MSNIRNWRVTASDNNQAAPLGAPEGWAPSSVNNTIRQQMADHRTQWEDAAWFDWGHTPVRQTNNSFVVSISNTVGSTIYTAGRRLKLNDATTIVGEVIASSASGSNTLVTVSSSNLTASLSSLSISILNPSVPSWPLASKRDMEAASISSSSQVLLTPSLQKFHPTMPRSFGAVVYSNDSGSYTLLDSWNVDSVSKSVTGVVKINFKHTLSSSAFYEYGVVNAFGAAGSPAVRMANVEAAFGSSYVKVRIYTSGATLADSSFNFVVFGANFAD